MNISEHPSVAPFAALAREIPAEWPDDSLIVVNIPTVQSGTRKQMSSISVGQWRALLKTPAENKAASLKELLLKLADDMIAGRAYYDHANRGTDTVGLLLQRAMGVSHAELARLISAERKAMLADGHMPGWDLKSIDKLDWKVPYLLHQSEAELSKFRTLQTLHCLGFTPELVDTLQRCSSDSAWAFVLSKPEFLKAFKPKEKIDKGLLKRWKEEIGEWRGRPEAPIQAPEPTVGSLKASFSISDRYAVGIYVAAYAHTLEQRAEAIAKSSEIYTKVA